MFTKISLLNISVSPHLIPQITAFLVRSLLCVEIKYILRYFIKSCL